MTQMPADHMPIQSHSTIDATPEDRRVAPPRHRGPRARAASALRWLARHMGVVLFGLLFVIPVTLVTTYYWFVASDQYRVETQFAVRGLVTSPLSTLGLAALPGASTQAGDSYIVADYIRSPQLIIDLRDQLDIDLRQYFSRSEIDVMQRIDPDAPLEEFVKYWRWRVDVGYNSTTGNTTFAVYAFNPQDANEIAQSVLLVSEQLVNNLSSQSRRQLIETAQSEVARTEERLRQARSQLQDFRNRVFVPLDHVVDLHRMAVPADRRRSVAHAFDVRLVGHEDVVASVGDDALERLPVLPEPSALDGLRTAHADSGIALRLPRDVDVGGGLDLLHVGRGDRVGALLEFAHGRTGNRATVRMGGQGSPRLAADRLGCPRPGLQQGMARTRGEALAQECGDDLPLLRAGLRGRGTGTHAGEVVGRHVGEQDRKDQSEMDQ